MVEAIREVIFDTETTVLSARDGDRVIEIGAIELVNRYPTGKVFHVFINPEDREVHPDALAIHGISNDFLKDKPNFDEISKEFLAFFSEGSLVAHNAEFDAGFLNAELARLGHPGIDPSRIVDTLKIARRKFPGQRNSLDALCARFAIDNSHRDKHGALLDSELLAEVYLELLGGKQASLSLEHDHRTETGSRDSSANSVSGSGTARQRPDRLPSRLTAEDIERHAAFVETLGENALWKKVLGSN